MIWILILSAWSIIGIFLYLAIVAAQVREVTFDFLNPLFLWNEFRVNIFGVICLTLFYNLLCPILSIIYWFYKLCIVGR